MSAQRLRVERDASAIVRRRRLSRRRKIAELVPTVFAIGIVVVAAAAALVPQLLAPVGPTTINPAAAFTPPGDPTFPLGTDESGRDVLSRLVWGARPSVAIGVSAAALATILGCALAFVSTISPRPIRAFSDRVIETAFAFPTVLLALLIIVATGPGAIPTTLAVGISTAPGYARIIREQIRSVRASGYWRQSIIRGDSPIRRAWSTLLPNATRPIIPVVTLGIGQAIVWASALSFLGLGAQPPAAEWGAMLSAGRIYIPTAPWLTIVPGSAIVLLAIATTILGRRIGDTR